MSIHPSIFSTQNIRELYALFDHFPQLVTVRNLQTNDVYINPAVKKFTGITGDEAYTVDPLNFIHPADVPILINAWSRIQLDEQAIMVTYRIRNSTGDYQWHTGSFTLIPDEDGKPLYRIVISTNVHQDKLQEMEVRENEERLRLAISTAHTGTWDYDILNGQCVYSFEVPQLFDLDPGEPFNYSKALAILHPEDKERITEAHNELLFNNHSPIETVLEYRVIKKDGSIHWYRTVCRVMVNAQGLRYRMVGMISDITETRKRQTELELLADLIPQLVWVTDAEGNAEWQNGRWRDFFGEQHRGNDWIKLLHPDDRQHAMDTWFGAVRSGQPYQIEYRFMDKETGRYRWFLGKAVPVKDETGKIINWLGTCTDIEDQKELKDNMDAASQLRTQQLQRLNQQLQRSNEDLQQFAYITSHDLKEPLRKISIFTDQLQQMIGHDMNDEAQKLLEKIRSGARRVSDMIENILHYSTSAEDVVFEQSVSLQEVMELVERNHQTALEEKAALLTYNQLPEVKGNRLLLVQLFGNLLNNSLKFSSPERSPRIQITVREARPELFEQFKELRPGMKYVEIIYQDNGIGFEPEFAQHIFKAFTRLHSQHVYEGTGLGLTLCQKIVERHKGYMYAEGHPAEGAVFHIFLLKAKG
jgi:PAS domain S-box-containing protein